MYNRNNWPDNSQLTVIASCTTKRFIAIQIFKHKINADEFLYFLQSVLVSMPRHKRVTVLADNASVHAAFKIQKSKAGKFLIMNSVGLFRANAIENAFSFCKAEWRKRPVVETIEEEALQIANIMFDPLNEKRFEGVAFNHARSLVGLFKLNFPKVKDDSEEVSHEDEIYEETEMLSWDQSDGSASEGELMHLD